MCSNSIKPNFLGIGAPKTGTSWLYKNLQAHPQVYMPLVKEISYFDQVHLKEKWLKKARMNILASKLQMKINGANISDDELALLAKLTFVDATQTKNINDLDNWYLSFFQDADINSTAIGEISTGYCALPEEGVRQIKNLLDDIKIIYILRNPIKRMWSNILMNKRQDISQGKTIEVQEWIELAKRRGNRSRANYKETITIYEQYFDINNILYLFYDEIVLNPLKLLEKVCNFLSIDYDIKYFEETASRVFNKNPEMDIPIDVYTFLVDKYKYQEKYIRERFVPQSFEL